MLIVVVFFPLVWVVEWILAVPNHLPTDSDPTAYLIKSSSS